MHIDISDYIEIVLKFKLSNFNNIFTICGSDSLTDVWHWYTAIRGGPNWAGRMHDNLAADMSEFWAAHFIHSALVVCCTQQ